MSTDLKMLTWTAALTFVLWLPYVLVRMIQEGLIPTVTYIADSKALPVGRSGQRRPTTTRLKTSHRLRLWSSSPT
jgi:hypothetical protein